MSLAAETIPIVGAIINSISKSTINTLEKDLQNAKDNYLASGKTEDDFYHFINSINNNPNLEVETEVEQDIKNLQETKNEAGVHLIILVNNLSLLNVRCNTEFKSSDDILSALFWTLPDFFRTDHFFNELKQEDISLTDENIKAIQAKSYVAESEFVKKQKQWFAPYEDSLMFFMGTQLLADIFN